jgi:hypothetical protein
VYIASVLYNSTTSVYVVMYYPEVVRRVSA